MIKWAHFKGTFRLYYSRNEYKVCTTNCMSVLAFKMTLWIIVHNLNRKTGCRTYLELFSNRSESGICTATEFTIFGPNYKPPQLTLDLWTVDQGNERLKKIRLKNLNLGLLSKVRFSSRLKLGFIDFCFFSCRSKSNSKNIVILTD